MPDARRTKADLAAELRALRERVAVLSTSALPGGDSREPLRRMELRCLHVLENARALIVEIDPKGFISYVSPSVTGVLGHSPVEVLHRAGLEWVHEDDRSRVEETYRKLFVSGRSQTAEYRARHKAGHWVWLETSGSTYRTPDGLLFAVALIHDTSGLKRAAAALRHSEDRYRVVAESTDDLVAELDDEGRAIYVSPSFERVLGYAAEELIGMAPFSLIHADDVERLAAAFQNRLRATRRPGNAENFRVRHRDGSWRWLQGGGVNYRTADGALRIVSVSRDVTERRRQEEERQHFEERMQQAQKLESLGVMAGGIAHDFNNLLTPILGDTSLVLADLPADSPVRPRLEKIRQAAQRAAALTSQMLAYAGTESLQVEAVDVSELVREMSRLIDSAIARKAALDYELCSDLPAIEGDPAQVSQIVINLVTNACEALGERGGHIVIRTGTLRVDRAQLDRLILGDTLPEGRWVTLEVADDGCGMDAETRARIFDPFFTTKFTGRGLGLAAVLGIVRGHGGGIEIDSRPGVGTRFRVLLPPLPGSAGHEVLARPERRGRRGTVLVADDDEGVRELASETLERGGWAVLSVADGRDAVRLFRDHADEVSAVLLDRSMPSGSGEETFDAIRRIRPDAPIILVSGYSQDGVARRFTRTGYADFLPKPFLPATLLEKVRRLVETQPPTSTVPVE
jgi:PAS domain S-box-containing protein